MQLAEFEIQILMDTIYIPAQLSRQLVHQYLSQENTVTYLDENSLSIVLLNSTHEFIYKFSIFLLMGNKRTQIILETHKHKLLQRCI